MIHRRQAAIAMLAPVLNIFGGYGELARASTTRQSRPVAGVNVIVWQAFGELFVEQTARERMTIEAEEAVLSQIVTEVRGQTLTIGVLPGRLYTEKPVRAHVEVVSLASLQLEGTGVVRVGALKGLSFRSRLMGSVDLRIAGFTGRSLTMVLEGSGDAAIAGGRVDAQRVSVAGSGSYDAVPMASTRAEVSVDGSGDARLTVAEHLQVHLTGSGNVLYRGYPTLATRPGGAGVISRME